MGKAGRGQGAGAGGGAVRAAATLALDSPGKPFTYPRIDSEACVRIPEGSQGPLRGVGLG